MVLPDHTKFDMQVTSICKIFDTVAFILFFLSTLTLLYVQGLKFDRAAIVCMVGYLASLFVHLLIAYLSGFKSSVVNPVQTLLQVLIWCTLIFFTFEIKKVKMKLSVTTSAEFLSLYGKLHREYFVTAGLMAIACIHGAWRFTLQILKYSFNDVFLRVRTPLNIFDLALSSVKLAADVYVLSSFAILMAFFVR